jgi:translation initiation factor IF-1
MPDASIHTLARITEARGTVHLAELKNGKTLIVHRSKPLEDAGAAIEIGDRVLLELTPFDFDSGRVIAINPESQAINTDS